MSADDHFHECPECAAKPGSPILCADCLRRREIWEKAQKHDDLCLCDQCCHERAALRVKKPWPYRLEHHCLEELARHYSGCYVSEISQKLQKPVVSVWKALNNLRQYRMVYVDDFHVWHRRQNAD